MPKKILSIFNLAFLISISAFGQTTVFSDDFSTSRGSTFTAAAGNIGSDTRWSISRSGADWGARIHNDILELTNDASATANVAGWAFGYFDNSTASAPWNTTLSSNTGVVTWEFNMRQIRTDPAGFGSGAYGVAFVLAGTSTTVATAGSGYAVVLGQSGGTDALRLATYNNGIQGTLTNLITSNTAGLTDFGVDYLSVRITYAPTTNTWEFFVRNDGTTSFADPTSGTLVSQGIVVNNTYTSTADMRYTGGYWQGSTAATQTSFFDNVYLKVTSASTPNLIVSPSSTTNFGNTTINTPTASTTYSISGNNLTGAPGNITITAPTDFQVSTNNTDFFASVNVAYSAATLSSTNFYVRFNPATGGAKTGNLSFSGGGVTTPPTISVSGTAVVNYYTKTSTATGLQNTTSWTTNAAGGAGTEPTNFTADAQIFNIANNATTTISGNWTVSGSGSKIVVSSGDFTIPSTATVTGTVDVSGGAELTIENATLPTFGTLAATSTVQYNDVAITLPASTTYGNLTLSGTGTKTIPGNTTTITGNFVVNNTTIDAPGSSPFATILLAGNLTYQGTVVNPITANSITLQTNGTAAGTQTFTGNGNTIRYFRIQSTTANTLLMSTTGGSTNVLVGNAASGGITLLDGSILNLNGNNLEFFETGGASLILNTSGSISGGATSDLIFARGGTSSLGTLRMTTGANTIRSLTLNHSGSSNTNLTLGNAINVTGTVTLTAGTLISNGNLTLKSTSATATANVLGGTNGSITGNVTAERFLPWASANNNGFRFISHPLASNPVINTVTNLPTATNTLVGYNESGNLYEGINDRTSPWPQGIGYGAWTNAASNVSFTGALQLSDVSAVSMGNALQRWNFAGNPFPSTLDWDATTRTDMQNAVWIWVKDDVAEGAGTWASYIDGIAANGGSRYIAPMQGFMVRTLNPGTPSIAYPAAARVSNQAPSFQRTQTLGDVYRVKVNKADNNSAMETVIRFRAMATPNHDAAYDAEFMSDFANSTPDLYTTDANGVKYSINALPELGSAAVLVPLQLETFGAGDFSFTFDASQLVSGVSVQLEDTKLATFTHLVDGQIVNFTAAANDAVNRFRLHFNGLATSVAANNLDLIQMYAHEGALYIRGTERAESLRILDISGRTVFSAQQLELDGNAIRPNLAKGTYLVQLVNEVGVKTVKVIF